MRLSSIKLAGFKSFVDPTALPLPSNLTSVVGPNGCGKSNIIDAVRWVLGESSMKQLRSESMEDVIFNGCKTRKPAGRASIELTFDNSDGTVQGPYAAYNEISVRRELTRDGSSQYYLNSAKCLKRDVTDLFLGTGLGSRSGYAIIEQGMVSRMIEAKPEELRQWLEEAAGISKYKERRRETESRIRQTRENLARLNDLRVELQGRLEILRKQAANAEKYKEYKEQERKLKAELLALRLRALEGQCTAQDAAIAELNQALETARAGLATTHEAHAQVEAANREAGHALAAQQTRVYEVEATLARQEQNLAHARELKAIKARELEQVAREIEELANREQREQARLTELTATLARQEAEAQSAETRNAEAQAALIAAEETTQAEQNRWEEFTQRAEAPLFQAEGERVRVQGLERALRQTEERIQKLQPERQALDATPIQAALFDADAELETLNRELSDTQSRLQILERDLQELRDQRAGAEAALHEARQSSQAAKGRMASLETLQQAALRDDDAELSTWLRTEGLAECPRLATVLQVEPGWETAVEHVLDGLLQAPLLPEFAARLQVLQSTPKAGIILVDQGSGGASMPGRLSSRVTGPAAVTEWLNGILAVESQQDAVHIAANLAPGESVITRDGVWRGRHWLRYPQVQDDKTGVLARGMLLRELRVEVEGLTASLRNREQSLDDLSKRIQALENDRRELATRFDQGRSRQAQRLAFRQAQAVRLEQIETRVRQLTQELQGLSAGREQQAQELAAARERLTALQATAQQLHEERTALQQVLAQARETLQRARAAANQAVAALQQAQLQVAGKKSALDALRQTLQDLAARRQTLLGQKAVHEQEAQALEQPLQNQAEDLEGARAAVQAAREELRVLREKLAAAEAQLAEVVQRTRQAEFAQDSAREKLQQARLDFQTLDVRRQTFADQIAETGFVRDELLQALAPDMTPEIWEEKLAGMARRIERLGAINLAAIQELEEAGSREKYLTEQHDDLVGALETLETAIRKIDGETKERFKQTFERVDQIFRDRFPKLFGGGEAYLELTGDDLLETGVRVMARPPGKRNSSIQLLSGGEKAMTAVALLLALFQLNPAPFCMLDEVDAPLDDANVGRFCDVIREMSENVQFIIITHNKITMELAQQLHGVTMQELGVSRLVSVDVQQAMTLAGKEEPEFVEPLTA